MMRAFSVMVNSFQFHPKIGPLSLLKSGEKFFFSLIMLVHNEWFIFR